MTNVQLITEILKLENKEDDIYYMKMLFRLTKDKLENIYNAKCIQKLKDNANTPKRGLKG